MTIPENLIDVHFSKILIFINKEFLLKVYSNYNTNEIACV